MQVIVVTEAMHFCKTHAAMFICKYTYNVSTIYSKLPRFLPILFVLTYKA